MSNSNAVDVMRVHQAAMPLGLSAAGGFATNYSMTWRDLVPSWLRGIEKSGMFFNPYRGRYQKNPPEAGLEDHMNYLYNHLHERNAAIDDTARDYKDWVEEGVLRREGYFPQGEYTIDNVPENDYAGFCPETQKLSLPSKIVNGKRFYDRNDVAHEMGRLKDLGALGLSKTKVSPDRAAYLKYPYCFDRSSDPKMQLGNSVESITNGPNKTDMIRMEENAWNNAPGRYDPKVRASSVRTYLTHASDAWRWKALDALSKAVRNGEFGHHTSVNLREGYDASKYYPGLVDLWRTNNFHNALRYLKTLKKNGE